MTIDEIERVLRERIEAFPPAARAELLHVLLLSDFDRAKRIGEFWSYPQSRAFAELLIGCEEDRMLRTVLVGMLRELSGDGSGLVHRHCGRDCGCRKIVVGSTLRFAQTETVGVAASGVGIYPSTARTGVFP